MTKKCGIYCIENLINHKKYIGLSRDIYRRWFQHRSELNRHKHNNQYLQASWDKYGAENFSFTIVELCDENVLSERECYYIAQYDTTAHGQGYNLTHGGENTSVGRWVIILNGGKIYETMEECAREIGVSHATLTLWCKQRYKCMYYDEFMALGKKEQEYYSGYDYDQYIHDKLSVAHSRCNLSTETINKLRRATSGKNNPRARKVYCPQLDEVFECIKDASDKYGINRGSITSYLKGRLGHAGLHPVTKEPLTWEII